ncbi:hypothetical protein LPTSP2_38250 [Leptospira ellinghausenii]|uniref:Uncharacterized protein n=1 Tax=Leptospira ellinghausenii TaxID=1917822 RepID=A0A2P2DIQ3_9LEPT|nr:hypothetical protein [Leptospira ellinghausenii]GBF44522.1 hypothetical protein LPTSP2_38250 [Leptospira ellinghausenii]
MNDDNFYKYDLYTLEHIYAESKFVNELDTISSLNESIKSFIGQVSDYLYQSIIESKKVDIEEFVCPNIDKELVANFSKNPLYSSYIEINISEFVFKKFLKRIFEKDGLNNESHLIQKYIHSWLERKLALNIVQDFRFKTLDVLKILIDKTEMLRGFYIDLVDNIPKEWVTNNKEDWTSIQVSPDKIVDSIRLHDKEFIKKYDITLSELSKEKSWTFVREATRDSEYIWLNSEFHFISSVLIRTDILLWIEFWDNLKLPIIQDSVFSSSYTFIPKAYLQLIAALTENRVKVKSDLKVLLFIVSKNFFKNSVEQSNRFLIYEDNERKNEGNYFIFEKGLEKRKEWLEEKRNNYEILVQSLVLILSNSEIEDWIFSYKPKRNNSQFKQDANYNSEIELLIVTYKRKFNGQLNFELEAFNLQKFNFYVEVAKEKEYKKETLILIEAMTNFVSSDNFFWDRTFSEPYGSTLKGLSFVISQQENPIQIAKELIKKFKTIHQGWKPSKIDHSPIIKESFICSGVALLFEYEYAFRDKREETIFFKELLEHILMQIRFSLTDYSEYYQIPLRLLFLVANKIFTEVKELFELKLIDSYDDFYSLLVILSIDKIPLLETSKELLKVRMETDFLLLKRQLKNRNQEDKIHELEKMIEILEIEKKES